jgi:hypothetical protein
VDAEVQALAGQADATLRALDKAEEALSQAQGDEGPAWLDFFDLARLRGFQGFSYLTLGHTDDARRALGATLGELPDHADKQRAVTLADIAATHVYDGDIALGCEVAKQALAFTARTRYATAIDRLGRLRRQLEPWSRERPVRELDDVFHSVDLS